MSRSVRSTKAAGAVERLRARSGNPDYSMSVRSDGLFVLRNALATGEPVGPPLPLDEFVHFVDGIDAAAPKRVSKMDVAFRSQLKRK
ncbi:MAG: hypothetical protein WC023_05370 [Rhodocyclaceae bacterium]